MDKEDQKTCSTCIFKEKDFTCGLTGSVIKKPVINCLDHKTIEEHEDEVQESRR